MTPDVLVIGAGPAGCAAGIRLAQLGYQVSVLERRALTERQDMTSGELLAPHTQQECDELGVALAGPWVCDRVHGVRNVYPDLSWTYHAFPEGFCYVQVDRGGFDAALQRRLIDVGATLHGEVRVTEIESLADRVVVHDASGHRYEAKVAIDAGGRHAPTLTALKLKREDPEFRQIAVALFFESFPDIRLNTWDRHFYGERGAMLSGSQIRPGLCRWVMEADLADKQSAGMRPVEFYESIAQKYDSWLYPRLTSAPRVGDVYAMAPLAYRVDDIARDRLVLAGDATGYISPITGQGVEFAMRMGRLAARAVDEALRAGDTSAAAFERYVQERRDELTTAVGYVRHQLRYFRDREALLRASTDDLARCEIMGPIAMNVDDRGTLAA